MNKPFTSTECDTFLNFLNRSRSSSSKKEKIQIYILTALSFFGKFGFVNMAFFLHLVCCTSGIEVWLSMGVFEWQPTSVRQDIVAQASLWKAVARLRVTLTPRERLKENLTICRSIFGDLFVHLKILFKVRNCNEIFHCFLKFCLDSSQNNIEVRILFGVVLLLSFKPVLDLKTLYTCTSNSSSGFTEKVSSSVTKVKVVAFGTFSFFEWFRLQVDFWLHL